jgi:hypothetical protein
MWWRWPHKKPEEEDEKESTERTETETRGRIGGLRDLQLNSATSSSYREAKKNLETWNSHSRRVKNHTRVKRMTDKVGAVLAEHNHLAPAAEVCAAPAQDLLIQADGGHSPIQEKDKRSFEALSAIV